MNYISKELDYVAIGSRIRKYRWESKISQEELAEAVGISTTHMSHIETGATKLSLSVLANISLALKVSADLILNGEKITSKISEIDYIFSSSDERQTRILLEVVRATKLALDKERVSI